MKIEIVFVPKKTIDSDECREDCNRCPHCRHWDGEEYVDCELEEE